MILLDTNLWVFATLGTNARAERLLDEIERGEVVSAINAYMVQEALNAFDAGFADFSPSEYNLAEITIEHVA